MFTFGREHEIKHAIQFIGNADKAALLINTINAVHDFLEQRITAEAAKEVFKIAFSEGKSGVWESTGSWIRKLSLEHREFLEVWEALSKHRSASTRYRVACHLNDIPSDIRKNIVAQLKNDKSKTVTKMLEARLSESKL